jgi:hypothetical protein
MEKQATSQQGNLSQKDKETKEGRRSLQHSHGRKRMTFKGGKWICRYFL